MRSLRTRCTRGLLAAITLGSLLFLGCAPSHAAAYAVSVTITAPSFALPLGGAVHKEKDLTKPTVGRIVHYTNLGDAEGKYPAEQQAAIITGVKVRESCDSSMALEELYVVDLCIFYRTGSFFMQDVPYSEDYARGHWSWMPYQKGQAEKTESLERKLHDLAAPAK